MALKQKASSHVQNNVANKRDRKKLRRYYIVDSSSDFSEAEESSDIAEDEWLVKCILDEAGDNYLIDWEGPWSPTWEPKENANDVAVQVWERKKRGDIAGATQESIEDSQPQQPAPIHQEDTRQPFLSQKSRIQIDLCSTPEDHNGEIGHHSASERRSSPLFFTPEPGLGLQAQSDEGETSKEIPETLPEDSKLPDSIQNIDRSALDCGQSPYGLKEPFNASLFEYIPISPIPSEYRLPGETGTLNERESRHSSISASAGAPKTSSLTPDTNDELNYYDSLQSQRRFSLESNQKFKEVDEVAETQSVILTGASSKGNPTEPRAEGVSLSSPHNSIANEQATLFRQVDCTASAVHLSVSNSSCHTSLSYSGVSSAVTAGHSDSVPETTVPYESQSSEKLQSQTHNSFSASILSNSPGWKENKGKMDKENQKRVLSSAEVMEKYSHVPGSTPAEKMRNASAERYGNIFESINTLRAASARLSESPARATSAEVTQSLDEVRRQRDPQSAPVDSPVAEPLPHRPEVPYKVEEHPVQTIQPSALTVNYTQPPRGSVQLGPSEFAITLPMDSRLKDDYEQVLRRESRNIRDFMTMSNPDFINRASENEYRQLETRMGGVLEQLGNITTHPDLNMIEHIRHSQSDLEQEASWGEYSSSKFLFLGYLVQAATGRELHFVVMVQGHKLLDILERFLLGKGFTYTRPRPEMGPGTDLEVSMAKDSLSFGIQTTRNDGIAQTYKPPSMIIALDRTFDAQTPSVEHMRTTFARNGSLLPVVRLLISNTSEHIERCLSDVAPSQRLRLLLHHTAQLLDVVGDLQDNAFNVQEDVEEVLSCLASDNFNANWSLPSIEPLPVAEPEELDDILRENQGIVTLGRSIDPGPTVQKRPVQAEDTAEQVSKRQRTETADVVPPSTTEPSTLSGQPLTHVEVRLQQSEKVLGELQHRYESRTKDLHTTRRERDNLQVTMKTLEQRVERQRDEITKLKDERTELKRDLQQARETIKNGGGSAAELEAANEEIRRLKAENASLERKADYEKNQSEYTREQYQTASTVAAQSGNEIRQLKSENELLKRKVAGEASRLRVVNMKSDQDRHLSRVAELELTLANRDDLLRRKEEELREIRKNRPSTRSTSTQPRSPKWASANSRPSSPGFNNNNHNGSNPLGRGSSALRFSSEMH